MMCAAGVPAVHFAGFVSPWTVLVMDLLGVDLWSLQWYVDVMGSDMDGPRVVRSIYAIRHSHRFCNGKFSLPTTVRLGEQMLTRLIDLLRWL